MMNPSKRKLFYSGKVKSIYETDEPGFLIAEFRDDTTAFDGEKDEKLARKGVINNQINAHIMQALKDAGILTHFESVLSPNESLVRRLKMIPLECVVRNITAGSLCRRLGIESGLRLNPSLYELFLKNDPLHDPMVNENHALSFGWATQTQLDRMKELSFKINNVLFSLFSNVNLILVDAKYEFGVSDDEIYLGDEISPDSCRIWDVKTKEPLDKDRFRKDMGRVVESYEEIAHRFQIKLP
ncbi:phosphoribosylaminoimidazolesuccinocarboxamide synthase [Coxiella endosymbiont of Ornithodoros amblus]|uniref:phosphoribosylaminoimidazolesuccinocarboxamide synthase n=1 Tax=Coxiella endosymbiont of Ornithodoros amblus TaxID=1656166 RepID=UPI00244E1423|nr:phosphoribosylaminoimidazolesuccinocarboxamide synthase [Coxiella endosymbiont of Ornithodoros amblus]MBW5802330.1 phosphoribosylaminoimidazolesuccinocarboxamide synthase [Coxiella endosymbiont of Ornithodoros amblus]